MADVDRVRRGLLEAVRVGRVPVRRDHRDRGPDDQQPDDRAEPAEQQPGQRHPADQEPVRVPQRDAREQHVHQPALHLPLRQLLVAAQQDGGVGGDVGVDQVGRVQVREDLDDFRLRRRVVGELAAGQVPGLARRCASRPAARRTGTPASRQPVELVPRRVADDVPPLAAVDTAARSAPRAAASPAGSSRGTRTRKMSGGAGGSWVRWADECRLTFRRDGRSRRCRGWGVGGRVSGVTDGPPPHTPLPTPNFCSPHTPHFHAWSLTNSISLWL